MSDKGLTEDRHELALTTKRLAYLGEDKLVLQVVVCELTLLALDEEEDLALVFSGCWMATKCWVY